GASQLQGTAALAISIVAGVLVLALSLRRALPRLTRERVALWVEEHIPLDFALVTAADPRAGSIERLIPRLTAIPWSSLVQGAARRRLALPAALALVAVAATLLLPVAEGALNATRAPTVAGSVTSTPPARPTSGPLANIQALVVPPAYSGLSRSTLDDPATITALVGSSVTISGRAGELASSVTARLGERDLEVAAGEGEWQSRFRM